MLAATFQPRGRRFLAAVISTLVVAELAGAAEVYVSGDIGIQLTAVEGRGRNDILGATQKGSDRDATPIFGAGLGVAFPLDEALPWEFRGPRFSVPYWPGRRVRFGEEETGLPALPMRFEIEYLRNFDAELATPGANPQEPFRVDVETWSVMAKLRADLPLRRPVHAIFGRVPILDPMSIYLGSGAGLASVDLAASNAVIFGDDTSLGLVWQALAGFSYPLNERVTWSVGWRYQDHGSPHVDLVGTAGEPAGRYTADLRSHEFTTSLSLAFWRVAPIDLELPGLPFFGDD